MRSRLALAVGLTSSLFACGPDVPEHVVEIVSDCNGPERTGRFRFPDTNFETSCGGGDEWASCDTTNAVATQISGDLEIRRLWLEGFEHSGPFAYWVSFDRPADDPPPDFYDFLDYIECRWHVFEGGNEVGEVQDCFYSSCRASLEIVE